MEERIKQISDLISEVRPTLLEVGIKTPSIVFRGKKIEELSDKQFEFVVAWFVNIRAAIQNYEERKKLVPESHWQAYAAMGVRDLKEQKILRAAKDCVIKIWRERPEALTRNTDAKPVKK